MELPKGAYSPDKPTWAEMESRARHFPEKDRAAVIPWVAFRRDMEEIAPGTMRNDLQMLLRASLAFRDPLLDAARSGALEAHAKAEASGKKDRGHYLSRWRVFLAYHKLPLEWTRLPRAKRSTRKRRQAAKRDIARTDIISAAEFRRAVDATGNPRDRCILYLLWDTGMRPSEVLALHYSSVGRDGSGHYMIRMPEEEDAYYSLKTGPREIVLIDSVAAVKEWLNHHPTRAGPLFPSARNAVVGRTHILKLVKRVLPGQTPKSFRHTAATRATLAKWSDAQMRKYFGWEKNSPMPSYYAEFTQDDANTLRLKQAGLLKDTAEEVEAASVAPISCPRCNTENVRENVYCFACKAALRADLVESQKNAELEAMREQIAALRAMMEAQIAAASPGAPKLQAIMAKKRADKIAGG